MNKVKKGKMRKQGGGGEKEGEEKKKESENGHMIVKLLEKRVPLSLSPLKKRDVIFFF